MTLRPYQQKVWDELREFSKKHKFVIVTAQQPRPMGGSPLPPPPDRVIFVDYLDIISPK